MPAILNRRTGSSWLGWTTKLQCSLGGVGASLSDFATAEPARDIFRLAEDIARLRAGIRSLTGRNTVLGVRYGDLAAAVRDAGGTVFDWVDDEEARAVVIRIGAADPGVAEKIAARSDEA